jgi:alpha-L-fucosidase 2
MLNRTLMGSFRFGFGFWGLMVLSGCAVSPQPAKTSLSHQRVVDKHRAVFTKPPTCVPSNLVVDGPLLGNGDIGVVTNGPPEDQRFSIGKNDFWDYPSRRIVALGGVRVQVPAIKGATYQQEQVLADAEVRGRFSGNGLVVRTKSWVGFSENLLIQEWIHDGDQPVQIDVSHWAGPHPNVDKMKTSSYYIRIHPDASRTTTMGREGDVIWTTRTVGERASQSRSATLATRVIGAKVVISEGHVARFEILPGTTIRLVTAVVSDRGQPAHRREALALVARATVATLAVHKREHEQWWGDFWSKSSVDIGDPLLEKFYYASHYIMACCSRAGEVAPGLYGNWITTDTSTWWGDYHLNYNHEAPFWGLYSSNHVAQSEPYDKPLLDFIPQGKRLAKLYMNRDGILYPVSLGPDGMTTVREYRKHHLFLGQKYNAAYGAVNMSMRFYHTYDKAYARKIYPYLLEVATFWEQDLKFENGRYKIIEDCVNETDKKPDDVNPINSMAMVKMAFRTAIDVSKELGVDVQRRGKWQHILDHFSPFPTYQFKGATVFQGADSGVSANGGEGGWALVEHIWPAGLIGLGSGKELLEISANTIRLKPAWKSHNCFPMIFPAAARVGYDPTQILDSLRGACQSNGYPNGFIFFGGGGIECASGVPATINEMLLQSHDHVLRLFPVWPKGKNAKFTTLRAIGAFLVTAELNSGRVRGVRIVSEKGRRCTLVNPWPGQAIQLVRDGQPGGILKGDRVVFPTTAGEVLDVRVVKGKRSVVEI